MNRHDIFLLQQVSGYPALTLTLPTHRTTPDNRQDPIRVKNLVTQAANRLLGEFSKRDIEPLLARLEKLAGDIDYRYTLDGLVLFVNHDFARSFQTPFTLPERVIVDDTFFTRDLVFAMNRTPRYWTLVLSEKATRLFDGTRDILLEIQEGGFPMVHTGPGGEQPLPGGFGVKKSAYRDEYQRKFFREVDAALKPFLVDDPLPVAVVGVDRSLAFFNEITAHKSAILTTLTGNHDKTSAYDLGQLVWPLIKRSLHEQRQERLAELDKAVSEQKYVSTVGEAWRLANEGRGRFLLVEEDFHFPARLDETGMHLLPAADPTAPDVMDDAVDELIETVLRKQGQVVFMENGQLAAHQRIALILRY
ncbi:MAG: hypothetical protein IAE79_27520 [Anaerolinea sp.]|nr:hypothetical protein [Anaerolinea sp.]